MKSCVITSPFHYEIREVPIPEPGDNEVLIQMKAAGSLRKRFAYIQGGKSSVYLPAGSRT